MTDAVLDLSAKSTSSDSGFSRRSLSNGTPPSPYTPRTPIRRFSSSDDNDSDSSLQNSAIRPVAGPMPTRMRDSPSSSSEPQDIGESSASPQSSSVGRNRPFKSYPSDVMASIFASQSASFLAGHTNTLPAMSLPVGLGLSSLYDTSSSFPSFPITPLTSHLLQRKRRAESRTHTGNVDNNSDSEDKKLKHVPEEKKDGSYWERRRKNNEAAKRSRDTRRHKEEEIAMRAAFLEQENLKLRAQVAILKNETAKLHYMLYNRL